MITKHKLKPRVPMYAIVHLLPTDCRSSEPFGITQHDKELQPLMDKALTELDLAEPLYIVRLNEDWTWDTLFSRAGDVWAPYNKEKMNLYEALHTNS